MWEPRNTPNTRKQVNVGTTEHTEHTEVRDDGGRIRFGVFGVFCVEKNGMVFQGLW